MPPPAELRIERFHKRMKAISNTVSICSSSSFLGDKPKATRTAERSCLCAAGRKLGPKCKLKNLSFMRQNRNWNTKTLEVIYKEIKE